MEFTNDPIRLIIAFALLVAGILLFRRLTVRRVVDLGKTDGTAKAAAEKVLADDPNRDPDKGVARVLDQQRVLDAMTIAKSVGLVAKPRVPSGDTTLAEEYLESVKYNLHCQFHMTLFRGPDPESIEGYAEAAGSLSDSRALLVSVLTCIDVTEGAPDLAEMHRALAPAVDFAKFSAFFRAERNICEKFGGDGLDRVMAGHVHRYQAMLTSATKVG